MNISSTTSAFGLDTSMMLPLVWERDHHSFSPCWLLITSAVTYRTLSLRKTSWRGEGRSRREGGIMTHTARYNTPHSLKIWLNSLDSPFAGAWMMTGNKFMSCLEWQNTHSFNNNNYNNNKSCRVLQHNYAEAGNQLSGASTHTGSDSVTLTMSVALVVSTCRNISRTCRSSALSERRVLSLEPDTTSAARPVLGALGG